MDENTFNKDEDQPGLFDNQLLYNNATQGQRFLNWLIDNLLMNFALSFATGYIVGYILLYVAPDFLMQFAYESEGEKGWHYYLVTYLIIYFNYIVYYIFCEFAFKGYTLGKLITGTKALRNDGNNLTLRDATMRSLSRIVPFELFSGLGDRPWHDSWTDTTVVKSR